MDTWAKHGTRLDGKPVFKGGMSYPAVVGL